MFVGASSVLEVTETVLDKGFKKHSGKEKCELLNNDCKKRAVASREDRLFTMIFKDSQVSNFIL